MKSIYFAACLLLISLPSYAFEDSVQIELESNIILDRQTHDEVSPESDPESNSDRVSGNEALDSDGSAQQLSENALEPVTEERRMDEQTLQHDSAYQAAIYVDAEEEGMSTEAIESEESLDHAGELVSIPQIKLPGEEINFALKLFQTNQHFVDGRAKSDIGKILFKSRLMPSNEVKLSLKLKQREIDDIELVAYFDLANYEMELDGGNAVLNTEHKTLMKVLNQHLRSDFEDQYKDYDFPEHAFMLVQMLSYWSVSPEGYVHEKRQIVADY